VVPLTSPVTTQGLPTQPVVALEGEAVTVYPVIAPPPLLAGALNRTVAWP
jgi:hypothetical protein